MMKVPFEEMEVELIYFDEADIITQSPSPTEIVDNEKGIPDA